MGIFPKSEVMRSSGLGAVGIDFIFENGRHMLTPSGDIARCADEMSALKNWIGKVVSTAVGRYEVYVIDESEAFGLRAWEHIGEKNRGYWLSELKREITQQLLENEYIDDVRDYSAEIQRRTVYVSFTVVSGEAEGYVRFGGDELFEWKAPSAVEEPAPTPSEPTPAEPVPSSGENEVIMGEIEIYGSIAEDIIGTAEVTA